MTKLEAAVIYGKFPDNAPSEFHAANLVLRNTQNGWNPESESLDSFVSTILAYRVEKLDEAVLRQKAEVAALEEANRNLRAKAGRYEKLRRLNVSQLRDLFVESLKGGPSFDELVDALEVGKVSA